MKDVFCLGLAVLDRVFECEAIPERATKYRALKTRTTIGGGAANGAIAIAKLGGNPRLAARLGDDVTADAIIDILKSLGLETGQLNRAKGGHSPQSSIIIDPLGERQIINFRGDGLSEATDWINLPDQTGAALVDTRWPKGMTRALTLARRAKIPGIVDVDTPLDACDLSVASHLAFARPALSEMTGTKDIKTALMEVRSKFGAWVCVTDGAKGCYALIGDALQHLPAPKIDVVDTLGAGDVWHGAFALRLAEGADEITACRFANAAAALKCAGSGLAEAMPDRATVDALVR